MSAVAAAPPDRLSYIQESIWLLDRIAARQGVPAYHEPFAYQVTGPLNVDALRLAVGDVLARHEAVRTTVRETADGLRAVVNDAPQPPVRVVDLRAVDAAALDSRTAELIDEEYRRPFDLAADALLRVIVVLLPNQQTVIAGTVHHLATDDWSNGLILRDLLAAYHAHRAGRGAAVAAGDSVAFLDYAHRERQRYADDGFDESIVEWKRTLADAPDLLRMPLDRPRPAGQTFAGTSRRLRVPRARVAALLEQCRRECRATDFTVFFAAYALLLQRYTGQDAVTVATTVLNRPDPEALEVVGCFVNTAALCLDLGGDPTFRELLGRAAARARQVLAAGDAPYPKVVEALGARRDPSHNPVFQTMLTMLGRRRLPDFGPDTTTRRWWVPRAAAKFELLWYVTDDDDAFEFELEFNTDLFTEATAERLLRHFATLLAGLVDNLDAPISTVSFLPDDERRLITEVWNDTAVSYPDSTVIDEFEAQARRTPDAVAVEFDGRSLTYDQLNRLTNQVARAIAATHSGQGSPFVGVYLERSLEMVVALVAIVKAGLAYVPIDPDYPPDRVQFMIEDSEVSAVVTTADRRVELTRMGTAEVMVLSVNEPRDEDDRNVRRRLTPDSPVYMIYTSGSTGQPKGAVNRHVSLFNRLWWMQQVFHITSEDRVLQKTPFSFDVSVWEFFWPLMTGARIVVARPGGHRDAAYMKRLIAERRVTTVHFIPSILNVFLDEDELSAYCGSLRRVICSGEALAHKAVVRFLETLPGCELHNLYGPTEAAIDVSHWPCAADYPGAVVPIGRPVANTQLVVVDRHLALQPVGVPGELCIGGVQLATGYHRRDELTRNVFVPDPRGTGRLYRTGDLARFLPDGQIQYLGRIDSQIKLRGVRIEPEEVSAALLRLPGIRDATVVLREAGGSRMLVGYVVADDFDQQRVKDALRTQLPEFMLPQVVMAVPALPTTPNGKLDRRALPDPLDAVDRNEPVTAPQTPDEEVMLRIWREVLGTGSLGVETNYFRHGGDSIRSVSLAARLRSHGYPVEVHDIFAHPTVRSLLAAIAGKAPVTPVAVVAPLALVADADRKRLPATISDAWPLSRLQAGMVYHTMLDERSSVYHDVFGYELETTEDLRPDLMLAAVLHVVRAHPVLRSTIDLDSYQVPLQLVHDDLDPPVEYTDLSPLAPAGQDRAVEAWTAAERQRPFDLAAGPLLRVHIRQRGPRRCMLGLSFHHAVLDGWSVALVVEQIRRAYADLVASGRRQPIVEQAAYSAFVELERRTTEDPASAAFWAELLGDAEPTELLPAGSPAVPVTTERELPETQVEAVRAVAAALGVAAKSVFLAVHLLVLGRLTGRQRIVSGLVSSGRPEINGGAELVGLFLNTLPFPIELTAESWSSLITRVWAIEQAGMAHRRYPLADIVRRSGGRTPFNTIFNYTDFHVYDEADDGVRITGAHYFEQTSFDVVVHLHRDHFRDRTFVTLNHDASRFDAQLAQQYLDAFVTMLGELTFGEQELVPVGSSAVQQTVERPNPPTAPAAAGPAAVSPVGAWSPEQRRVADILAEATGVPVVSLDDDYLQRGVDSISAIRVVAKLRRIDPSIGLAEVFAGRTVRTLATRLGGNGDPAAGRLTGTSSAVDPAGVSGGVVDPYPASQMQMFMMRATDADPRQAQYHDVFSYHLALPLDPDLLATVLRYLGEAYETLRGSFALDTPGGTPLRLVHASEPSPLSVATLPADDPHAAFDRWFEREKETGFDWAAGAPIRWFAHRWSAGMFTLTVSFHHAVLDGWSLSLVMRDLVRRYADALGGRPVPAASPEPPVYRDFVAAERAASESPQARAFWLDVVAAAPAAHFTDRTGAATATRWSETAVVLPPERREALERAAAGWAVPVKSVFLAAHLVTLSLLTGASPTCTGVFTNGRLEEEGWDETVGMFLNFVPLVDRLHGSWGEIARRVFDQERRALPYRRFPLPELHRAAGRSDLFPAIFNYTRFPAYADIATGADGAVTGMRWFEHTSFPLLVNVGHELDQRCVVLTLNADGRRLSQRWVEGAAALYDAVLAQLAGGAAAPAVTFEITEALGRLGQGAPATEDRKTSRSLNVKQPR